MTSRLSVIPSQLHDLASQLRSQASSMERAYLLGRNAYHGIDWMIANRAYMESRIQQGLSLMQRMRDDLYDRARYLDNAANRFAEADRTCTSSQTGLFPPPATGICWFLPGVMGIGSLSLPIYGGLAWFRNLLNGNGTASGASSGRTETSNGAVAQQNGPISSGDVGKRIADFGTSAYASNFKTGECTWYCAGRAKEIGEPLLFKDGKSGNAGSWLDTVSNHPTSRNPEEIRGNSIAVSSYPAPTGHVMFIERVENGKVYFTEANWFKDAAHGLGDGKIDTGDGVVKEMDLELFIHGTTDANGNHAGRFIDGYIYLN